MRVRLKGAKLVDEEDREVGRITKLEFELDVPAAEVAVEQLEIAGGGLERGDVEKVWDHYVSVMKPRNKKLDDGTRRIIREALKVATVVECNAAIDGCYSSDYHMRRGEFANRGGSVYKQVSQILKGKRGGRSTREQIDFFLDIAGERRGAPLVSSVDSGRLREAKRSLLDAWEMPGNETARKSAEMSAAWLAQHGFTVDYDPATGRPIVRGDGA